MGWNKISIATLPFGFGTEFPAYLTWRSGVDLTIIDLMRSLFDKGVRPESFSNLLLEMHTKEYTKIVIKRERMFERDKHFNPSGYSRKHLFSEFVDNNGYAGFVPTGRYLQQVYKLYHGQIRNHLNNEVKKRGAERLHWDASYKEPKH